MNTHRSPGPAQRGRPQVRDARNLGEQPHGPARRGRPFSLAAPERVHRSRGPAQRGNPLRGILTPAVRRWLYGIAAAVAPLATVYGLVTEQQAVLWLNLVGALLFTIAVGNTPARPSEKEDAGQ